MPVADLNSPPVELSTTEVQASCAMSAEAKHIERNIASDEEALKHEDTPEQVTSVLYEALLVAIISLPHFCTQAGVGGPLAILHIIGHELGITKPAQLSWLMAAYSLTVGTFILPFGRVGDVFGHKFVLIIGLTWFSLWSLVAGLSIFAHHKLVLFVLSRAMQGIGPAICLPNALAILGRRYQHGQSKNVVFAVFGASAPLGSVAGAVFASLCAEYLWWPWTFWILAIVLAVATGLTWLLVSACPGKGKAQEMTKIWTAQLDPLGTALGVTALLLFSFAWNQAPVSGWSSPAVVVSLLISVTLIPAFFYNERHLTPRPILPAECFNKNVAITLLCVGLGWSCFGIFLYYTWQFFELLRGASPLLASGWYSTNGVSGVVAAIATGFLLESVGAPIAMMLAMLAYVIGTMFIATAPVQQTYWANSFLCLVIVPFGMDISFPAASVLLSDALPDEQQGTGASLVTTVVNYSISLGLGIAGTVDAHVGSGGKTPADILRGFRGAWYTGIGLSGLGLAISLFSYLHPWRCNR